ncbi:MAG: hypothetical protein ACRDQA_16705 [Nocardioidaceae bacterium]
MFVDRVRRRTMLIWGNVVTALAVVPLLLVHDESDVRIIYVVALLYGVSEVVLPAALYGLFKEMLSEDLLAEANASRSTTQEGLRLIGPFGGRGFSPCSAVVSWRSSTPGPSWGRWCRCRASALSPGDCRLLR